MRHLKAFYIFHQAALSSSFTEAAEKLNLTHGAVSKQIKVLEGYLGLTLFARQGRHVVLTEAGKTLSEYTGQAFFTLEAGVEAVVGLNQQSLDISCEPTLTMRWLMPRLSDFYTEHPGTDIRLSTAGGAVTLGPSGIAMAIRRDDFPVVFDYQKRHLTEEWVGPVFAPRYWDEMKEKIEQVKLLHTQTRPEAWSEWISRTGYAGFANNSQQTFAHFYFSLQAAVDGLGAAMGPYPLVADDLRRGNLIAPFGFNPSGYNYILLRQDTAPTELENTFIHWLDEKFSDCIPTPEERAKIANI